MLSELSQCLELPFLEDGLDQQYKGLVFCCWVIGDPHESGLILSQSSLYGKRMTVVANHQSSCYLVQESLIELVHVAQQVQYHHMDSHIDQFPNYHCIAVHELNKVDEQLHQFCLHSHIILISLESINQSIDLYLLQDTFSQNHIIDQHVIEKSNRVDDDLFVLLVNDEVGVDDDYQVGGQQRVIVGRFVEESSHIDEQLKCIDVDMRIFLDYSIMEALIDQLTDYLWVFVEDCDNEADSHDLQVILFLRAHILKLVNVKTVGKYPVGYEDQLLVLNNGLLTGPDSDHDVRKCAFLHWVEVQNKKTRVIEVIQAISQEAVVHSSITLVLGGKNPSAFQNIKQCMLDNSLDFLLGQGTLNNLIENIHIMRPLHSAYSFHLSGYFLNLICHNRSHDSLRLSYYMHKVQHTPRQRINHPPHSITDLFLMPIILLQGLPYLSEVILQPLLPNIVPKCLFLHLYVILAILPHDELMYILKYFK